MRDSMAYALFQRHAMHETARRRSSVRAPSCAACASVSSGSPRPTSPPSSMARAASAKSSSPGRFTTSAGDGADHSSRSTARRSSNRCSRPSCSASKTVRPPACGGGEGKFESADGGTLFLDEVADLSTSAQAKLLRALQDLAIERVGGNGIHRVNTRVIAATNKSLCGLVRGKLFRADLFYRLSGIEIHVPPCASGAKTSSSSRRTSSNGTAQDRRLTHLAGRGRRAAHLRLAGQRPRARADDGTHAHARPSFNNRRRTISRFVWRRVRRRAAAVHGAERHAARVGKPLRPARARAERPNKRKACRALGISYHTLQAYLRYAHKLQASGVQESPPEYSPDS